jgi:hypothetical protein
MMKNVSNIAVCQKKLFDELLAILKEEILGKNTIMKKAFQQRKNLQQH